MNSPVWRENQRLRSIERMADYTSDASPLDGNGLPYQSSDALGGADAGYRNPLGRQQQLLPQVMEADTALTRHQLDAIDALRQYQSLRMKDAVQGFAGFKQALQSSRDAVLQDISPQAKALLKPHLDSTYIDSLQVGQDHQIGQDHAWSDQSSLDSMHANLQEALLHRANPGKVQQLADHSTGEWFKIGERKGWSPQDIGQQAMQTKAQLFGAVIDANLQDGNLVPALATLVQAKGQVDPANWKPMQQTVQAHVDSIVPPPQGEDTIMPSKDGDTLYGGGDGLDVIDAASGGKSFTTATGDPTDIPPPSTTTPPGSAASGALAGITAGGSKLGFDPYVTPRIRYWGAVGGQTWHGSFLGKGVDSQLLPPTAIEALNGAQIQRLRGLFPPAPHVPGEVAEPLTLSADPRQAFLERFNVQPPDRKQAMQATIERELRTMGVNFLTEQEWIDSPWHRDMPFEPFMTPERAQAKAEAFDVSGERKYQIQQAPHDFITRAGGAVVGFGADPLNWIGAGAGAKAVFGLAKAGGAKMLAAAGANVVNSVTKAAPQALTATEGTALRKILNIFKNNYKSGDKGDIAGVVSDMIGSRIPKPNGEFYNHFRDTQGILAGLRNNAYELRNATDPAAIAARERALQTIKEIEDAIKGLGL